MNFHPAPPFGGWRIFRCELNRNEVTEQNLHLTMFAQNDLKCSYKKTNDQLLRHTIFYRRFSKRLHSRATLVIALAGWRVSVVNPASAEAVLLAPLERSGSLSPPPLVQPQSETVSLESAAGDGGYCENASRITFSTYPPSVFAPSLQNGLLLDSLVEPLFTQKVQKGWLFQRPFFTMRKNTLLLKFAYLTALLATFGSSKGSLFRLKMRSSFRRLFFHVAVFAA